MIGINLKKDVAQKVYDELPIGGKCTWPGTDYIGEGRDARLLICGAPAVGRGFFEDPKGEEATVHDLCERHNRPVQSWDKIDPEEFVWGH